MTTYTIEAELHFQPSSGAPGDGDWFYLQVGEVRCLLDAEQAQEVVSEVFDEDSAEQIWNDFTKGDLDAF